MAVAAAVQCLRGETVGGRGEVEAVYLRKGRKRWMCRSWKNMLWRVSSCGCSDEVDTYCIIKTLLRAPSRGSISLGRLFRQFSSRICRSLSFFSSDCFSFDRVDSL